jgi:large subunit ribosomal protein L15
VINLERLVELGETKITQEVLVKNGLAGKNDLIKILGDGELKSALHIQAHKFSKPAQEKITKAGGTAELIGAPASGTPSAPAAETKPEKKPKKK